MLALVTNAALLGAPETRADPDDAPTAAGAESPSNTSPEAEYRSAIEQLREGVRLGDEQPEEAIPVLERALAELEAFRPQLARDAEAQSLRAEAYVSLARAHLLAHDDAKARAAMDEGIRSAPFGEDLPAIRYGPRVEKLWKARLAHVRKHPRQEVVVECWVACRVYVNERLVEIDEPGDLGDASEPVEDEDVATQVRLPGLTPGRHRLWVEAVDDSIEPLRAEFEPGEAGEPALDFSFGSKPEEEPNEPTIEGPEPESANDRPPDSSPPPKKRLLPRPVEISAVAAGVGLIVSGAVLFAIDGSCANDATSKDAVPADGNLVCPSLWATQVAGMALMGSGAGLTALGTAFLSVDEVRTARAGKSARVTIGWQLRF